MYLFAPLHRPPPKKKKNLTTLMGTNILPENLKGGNILCNLGLHCQWVTYTFFMLVLDKWLYRIKKALFSGGKVVHTCRDTTS